MDIMVKIKPVLFHAKYSTHNISRKLSLKG